MTIMIVEDHPGMRAMIREVALLALPGSPTIVECGSGEEAVARYATCQPDCVLMDFQLGQMNGLEATRLICDLDRQAFVVLVTSYDAPGLRSQSERLPLQGLVSKDDLAALTPILQTLPTQID